MSDELLDSPEGDWLLANLSDNDLINQNNPALSGMIQKVKNPTVSGLGYTKVYYRQFMCGACGEILPELDLRKHHSAKHSEVPFNATMFELSEVDEVVACCVCNAEMEEENFAKHRAKYHPETFTFCSNRVECDWQTEDFTIVYPLADMDAHEFSSAKSG